MLALSSIGAGQHTEADTDIFMGIEPKAETDRDFLVPHIDERVSIYVARNNVWDRRIWDAEKWRTLAKADIGDEPPKPQEIEDFLDGNCPLVRGEIARNTHTVAIIPERLGEELRTFAALEILFQRLTGTNLCRYAVAGSERNMNVPPTRSRWVVFPNAPISSVSIFENPFKSFSTLQGLVTGLNRKIGVQYPCIVDQVVELVKTARLCIFKAQADGLNPPTLSPYRIPSFNDLATIFFMKYMENAPKPSSRLYLCSSAMLNENDHAALGSFDNGGLHIVPCEATFPGVLPIRESIYN